VCLILVLTFLIRAPYAEQPIVENYVGRQVPTAMVARNLERGSGLLRPQLDTAPFPNYFLVEPPLYELGVVALRKATGFALAPAGRLLSALASVLGAWGLYDLVRRRQGVRAALWSASAFAIFPLTIRYGRAFQPDALMLGSVLAGLACWDRFQSDQGWSWMTAGWCLLALGFALKITSAVLLIPLLLVIVRPQSTRQILASLAVILPALLWYGWAFSVVEAGAGSRASADNRAIWLGVAGPAGLFRREALEWVVRFLIVRAFTPLGAGLAIWGLYLKRDERGRLWRIWGLAALLVMAMLAQKLHHEYYWLILAPVVAAGVGIALDRVTEWRPVVAAALFAVLFLSSVLAVRATWHTPPEWSDLPAAARSVAQIVPPDEWVASSEALLFQSDRRGCRMEWSQPAAQRAAGEWGAKHAVAGPLDLLAFYRNRGARFFADMGSGASGPERKLLHDAIRQRYKVIMDRPEVIIADLVDSGVRFHAN
jgi:hypothetical protein